MVARKPWSLALVAVLALELFFAPVAGAGSTLIWGKRSDGSLHPYGQGKTTSTSTTHVRSTFLVPTSATQQQLEDSIGQNAEFQNLTTVCLSSDPVLSHAGATTNYSYDSGALCDGVTVDSPPAITWNTDHWEIPLRIFTYGGHDYDGVLFTPDQEGGVLSRAIFVDPDYPDQNIMAAAVATDSSDPLPPGWGNPAENTSIDGTTDDFALWMFEFDSIVTTTTTPDPQGAMPVIAAEPLAVAGVPHDCTYTQAYGQVPTARPTFHVELDCGQGGCDYVECINADASKAIGVRPTEDTQTMLPIPPTQRQAYWGEGLDGCYFDSNTIATGATLIVGALGCKEP